jgi:bla regulator protein blaR1
MITLLLKSVLCSAVLLGVYWWVLRPEKMYVFNRFFLVGALLLSVVLPWVEVALPFEGWQIPSPAPTMATSWPTTVSQPAPVWTETTSTMPSETNNWMIFGWLYGLITSVLGWRFLKNLWKIRRQITAHRRARRGALEVVLLPEPVLPYSFGRYVFVNEQAFEQDQIAPEIWRHEEAHVTQRHSLDILWVELWGVLLWFNPCWWIYRRAIALNHEFLADAWVLQSQVDTLWYQYLLLNTPPMAVDSGLVSAFNFQITKKRFAMMNKKTPRLRAVALQGLAWISVWVCVGLFGDITLAQEQPAKANAPTVASPKPTSQVVEEYQNLVQKFVKKTKDKNGKEFVTIGYGMTEPDRIKLQNLFLQMTPQQQAEQIYVMNPPMKYLPKITPTEKDYASYKNPRIYGVWIDGKKVPNSELDRYQASDFSLVFVSKLYKNAQATIGYRYKFQLDLETHAYYEKEKAKSERENRYWLWYNMKKDQQRKSEKQSK